MTSHYYRVSIDGRKSGKWNKDKAFDTTNECKLLEICNNRPLIRVAINHNDSVLAVGDQLGYVYIVNIWTQHFFALPSKFDSCVTCVAFADDSKTGLNDNDINLIVATSNNNSVHCVSFSQHSRSSKIIETLSSVHKTCVNHVTISGERMLTSSPYDRSCLWDLNTLTLLKQLEDERCSLSMFVTNDRIIATYSNNIIYMLDSDTLEVLQSYRQRKLINVQMNRCFVTRTTNARDSSSSLVINAINEENNLVIKPVTSIEYNEAVKVKNLFCYHNNRIVIYHCGDGTIKCRYGKFDHTRYMSLALRNDLMVAITNNGDIQVFDLKHLKTARLRIKAVMQQSERDRGENEREREREN